MLVGWGGNNGSTLTAGVIANKQLVPFPLFPFFFFCHFVLSVLCIVVTLIICFENCMREMSKT